MPKKLAGSAIVMVAIVMVVGAVMLTIIRNRIASNIQEAQNITNARIVTVRTALFAYFSANQSLPYPAPLAAKIGDAGYGKLFDCTGDLTGTGIANVEISGQHALFGAVPFITLNIPENSSYDAWGSKILYSMVLSQGDAGTFSSGNGVFTVNKADSAAANNQAVVLVSFGPTKVGAVPVNSVAVGIACDPTTADGPNCGNSGTFYSGIANPKPGASFYDDSVNYFVPS